MSDIGDPWDEDLALDPVDLEQMSDSSWRIENDSLANWALRKIDQKRREIDRIKSNAEREIDRITQAKNAAVKTLTDDAEFFRRHLIDYRRRLEAANRDLPKTYKLPQGKITRCAGSVSVAIVDEDEFVCWALDNDQSLLSISPSKDRIRKAEGLAPAATEEVLKKEAGRSDTGATSVIVTTDGEQVPGVELVVGPDKYDASPA